MIAALEGSEWSAARPGYTLPRERHGTHFTGGWVGPRAGLDRRKISSPPRFYPAPSSPRSVAIPTELPGPPAPHINAWHIPIAVYTDSTCRWWTVRLLETCRGFSWFQTFAVFWILYVFFWVFPRRLIVVCRLFRTPYLFHLHRLDMKYEVYFILLDMKYEVYFILHIQPTKMEQIEFSETSAYNNQTPGKYPKEYI